MVNNLRSNPFIFGLLASRRLIHDRVLQFYDSPPCFEALNFYLTNFHSSLEIQSRNCHNANYEDVIAKSIKLLCCLYRKKFMQIDVSLHLRGERGREGKGENEGFVFRLIENFMIDEFH